jgi:hypothetical protein
MNHYQVWLDPARRGGNADASFAAAAVLSQQERARCSAVVLEAAEGVVGAGPVGRAGLVPPALVQTASSPTHPSASCRRLRSSQRARSRSSSGSSGRRHSPGQPRRSSHLHSHRARGSSSSRRRRRGVEAHSPAGSVRPARARTADSHTLPSATSLVHRNSSSRRRRRGVGARSPVDLVRHARVQTVDSHTLPSATSLAAVTNSARWFRVPLTVRPQQPQPRGVVVGGAAGGAAGEVLAGTVVAAGLRSRVLPMQPLAMPPPQHRCSRLRPRAPCAASTSSAWPRVPPTTTVPSLRSRWSTCQTRLSATSTSYRSSQWYPISLHSQVRKRVF